MMLLDSALYFFGALFCFGEWQSVQEILCPLCYVIVMQALSKMFSATVRLFCGV
jgi:hypothetical protein